MRVGAALAVLLVALTVVSCTFGRAALEFSPAQLPGAMSGQPYSAAITVTQNETPVGDMYVASGSLPPGLRLDFDQDTNSTTGRLAGTPTATGSYTFKVAAWCLGTNVSGQTGEHEYTLTVT